MGDRLFTQPAALGASGAVCAATGTGLLGSTVTPTVALPAQATAAAVTAAHLPISTATTTLAGRAAHTGGRLGEAATGFTSQDDAAAHTITATAPTILA